MAKSTIQYYSGGWQTESYWLEFKLIDPLHQPRQLRFTVSDVSWTIQNRYSSYISVRLLEANTGDTLFEGRAESEEDEFDPSRGHVLKVVAYDYMQELNKNALNRDYRSETNHSGVVSRIVRDYVYTRLAFSAEAGGNFAAENWIRGAGGAIAQVQSRTASYLTVQYYNSATEFINLELITEYPTLADAVAATNPTGVTATAGVTTRNVAITGIETSDQNISGGPLFDNLNYSPLKGIFQSASQDRWDAVPTGYGYDFYVGADKTFYYWKRGKYLGINSTTEAMYGSGLSADTSGLTLALNETQTDQLIPYFPDYEFPHFHKDQITRVRLHYRGTDESAKSVLRRNSTVENSLQVINEIQVRDEHITNDTEAQDKADALLAQYSNAASPMKGTVHIGNYPKFIVGGTDYFVRAGHKVHIHNSNYASVHNTDMIITRIEYQEPSGISEIRLIQSNLGFEDVRYDVPAALTNSLDRAQVGNRQSLAIAGLNLDNIAPAQPAGLAATGLYDTIMLNWTANTEADLSHYEIYRNVANDSSTATLITTTKARYYLDGNVGTTTYYYWIKAVDIAGNASVFSTVSDAAGTAGVIIPSGDIPKGVQPFTSDITFSPTPGSEDDNITYTNGTIRFVDTTTRAITGSTLDLSSATGWWYIYFDTGSASLAATQTYSTCVSESRGIIALAVHSTDATQQVGIFPFYAKGNNIIADAIATSAITALKVAANAITAGKLEADLILASVIRTASSGARVEIVGNGTDGIFGYNSGGTQTFSIEAADGKAKAGAGAVILDENGITLSDTAHVSGIGFAKYFYEGLDWRTLFETHDGFTKSTSGTAAITGPPGAYLRTGATLGSVPSISFPTSYAAVSGSWGKGRRFKTRVWLPINSNNFDAYLIVGYANIGVSTIQEHFGFRFFSTGQIQGTVADGSTESISDLQAFSGLNEYLLEAVFTPATSVVFYINGSNVGSISTNLPTGSSYAQYLMLVSLYNTAAEGEEIDLSHWLFLQEP